MSPKIRQKVFQISGFSSSRKQELHRAIKKLGGRVSQSECIHTGVTHIICGKPSRSEKFLGGLAMGSWLLTIDFVQDSLKVGKWQDEAMYEWNSSKRSHAPNVENIDALLEATTRWRCHLASLGTGPFLGWRAVVLVANEDKQAIYRRLLELGGATIVSIEFPVKRPSLIAREVSHVFVEEPQIAKVQGLLKHGVLCLYPVFIGIFLITDPPPEPRQHLVTGTTLTCSQPTRACSQDSITPDIPDDSDVSVIGSVGTPTKENMQSGSLSKEELKKSPRPKSWTQTKLVTVTKKKVACSTHEATPRNKPALRGIEVIDLTDSEDSNSCTSSFTAPGSLEDAKPKLPQRKITIGKPRLTLAIPERAPSNGIPQIPDGITVPNRNINRASTPISSVHPVPQLSESAGSITPLPGTSGLSERISLGNCPNTPQTPNMNSPSRRICHKCESPHRLSLKKTRECESSQKAKQLSFTQEKGSEIPRAVKRSRMKFDLYGPSCKRRKMDLPWGRACPDIAYADPADMKDRVVMQVSNTMTGMFEASLEENHIKQSLHIMGSSVSTLRYPQPKALHSVINILLNAKSKAKAHTTYRVLRRIVSLHPPTSPSLQQLYLVAISGAVEEDRPVTGLAWELIKKSLRILIDKDSQDEHLRHWLFLKFVVTVVETNMAAIMSGFHYKSMSIASSMWAQILWSSGRVGQYNMSVTSLLDIFIGVLLQEQDQQMNLIEMLQSMVALTASCCHHNSPDVNTNGDILARELAYLIKGHVNENPFYLRRVLGAIEVPWLLLHVVLTWLELYDDSLFPQEDSQDDPLCLKKIVSRYFFLLPPLLPLVPPSPHTKSQTKPQYPTPLRDVKHGKKKSSPCKTPICKSDAAIQRQIMAVNKKNLKGETKLHRACISNNVVKAKEILQTPGVDVNAADNVGWTPLHEACNRGSIECLHELLKYRPPKTITTFFSPASNVNQSKLDLMPKSEEGITPLHDAVMNNQVEVVKILLQYGGKDLLEAKTAEGHTPLDYCKENDDVMREALTSTNLLVPSSPCVTPVKRKAYFPVLEDSAQLSQGSQSTMDHVALAIVPPPEESYIRAQAVPSTSPASPAACLNLAILLHHLIQSYMFLYDVSLIKQHVISPSLQCCPLPDGKCTTGGTHTSCLCRMLGEKLGVREEHLLEDLGILRYWSKSVEMLQRHLERIGDGELMESTLTQLKLIELLGSLR